MADTPLSRPHRITGQTLDAATRERLLAVLEDKLAWASRDALAQGISPDELAVQFDERIARLRARIAELAAGDS